MYKKKNVIDCCIYLELELYIFGIGLYIQLLFFLKPSWTCFYRLHNYRLPQMSTELLLKQCFFIKDLLLSTKLTVALFSDEN